MIEDEELRTIFKAECDERLQRLEEGLLQMEAGPANAAVLDEVLREAHSLKGAARMLGLSALESLSHRVEDLLVPVREGTSLLTAELIDRLSLGLEGLRSYANEAVTGELSPVVLSATLQRLTMPQAEFKAATDVPLPVEPKDSGRFPGQNDTVRIETGKLDRLMSQAGELKVANLRLAQRHEDAKELVSLWESHSRDLALLSDSAHSLAQRIGKRLSALRNRLYEESSRLDLVTGELEEGVVRMRLVPLSTVFNQFQRSVRELSKDQGKVVTFVIEGGETLADKHLVEEIKDPLMHLIRNAVDHGLELPGERERVGKLPSGTIRLKGSKSTTRIVIEISDDGRGLDLDALKVAALKRRLVSPEALAAMTTPQIHSLIFCTGLSTSDFVSDLSGRGVGLDVVRVNVERLKGSLEVESSPGSGCTIRIELPPTVTTSKVIIVAAGPIRFAIPMEHIISTTLIRPSEVFTLAGRRVAIVDQAPIPVADLAGLLELKNSPARDQAADSSKLPCVFVSAGGDSLGLLVDELVDEQDVVVKPYSGILKRSRNLFGSSILEDGEVCLILNPADLIHSAKKRSASQPEPQADLTTGKRILVADDSMTVRTQIKRILEGAGYLVTVAVDGFEAWKQMQGQSFDAVVSDIQMPNMTGLELAEKIRGENKYVEVPIILVSSLASAADRKRGMEAGANAYIAKPSFEPKLLLDTLSRLV